MKTNEQITLDYYSDNAESFCRRTGSISFNPLQERFLARLPEGSRILDFGCGSGRDALAFQKAGHSVTALDGTRQFIDRLKDSGLQTVCCSFREFKEENLYEGIWACASLLHLEPEALDDTLKRLHRALKPEGIFYCSMKKGHSVGIRNGRYFLDQTEETLRPSLLKAGFEILELFETQDVRAEEKGRPWINAICTRN